MPVAGARHQEGAQGQGLQPGQQQGPGQGQRQRRGQGQVWGQGRGQLVAYVVGGGGDLLSWRPAEQHHMMSQQGGGEQGLKVRGRWGEIVLYMGVNSIATRFVEHYSRMGQV